MTKISNKDLFQGSLFTDVNKEAKATIETLDKLELSFKDVAKSIELVSKESKELNSANIERINTAFQGVNKVKEASIEVSRKRKQVLSEEEKITARLVKAQTQEGKQLANLREQLRRTNAENRASAKANLDSTNKFVQLTRATKTAQAQYQKFAATLGVGSKEAINAEKRFNRLNSSLEDINTRAKNGSPFVGRYTTAFRGLSATFGKIAGGLGIAVGFQALTRVITDSVKIFREFELGNARLAGLLNTNRAGISELTEDAKRLGSTTAKTASEVTLLQQAYARLGFSQKEILDLTEATINGSLALNASLDETATLTGAVVNTFNEFGTSDAPLILDQLTLATQSSALDFQKLSTAIPIASGAAAAAGVPFTKFIAQLGNAADRGIDASTAATSLRNIYIELSKSGLTLEQALGKINGSQDKLSTATDLFGKRASVTALALANTTAETGQLDKALQGAAGTAEAFAKETLNTLDGQIKLLSSAWEGFILSIESGDGALGQFLRGAIRGISTLLGLLSDVEEETRSIVDQNLDLVESTQKNIRANESLVESYEDLSGKVTLTAEEKAELDSVTNELIATFGDSIAIIDDETGALTVNIEVVKQKIIADQILQSEAAKTLLVQRQQLQAQIKNIEDAERSLDSFAETGNSIAVTLREATTGGVANLQIVIAQLRTEFQASGRSAEQFDETFKNIIESAQTLAAGDINLPFSEAEIKRIDKALSDLGLNFDDLARSQIRQTGTGEVAAKQTEELTGLIEIQEKVISDLNKAIKESESIGFEGDADSIRDLQAQLKLANEELDRLLGKAEEIKTSDSTEQIRQTLEETLQLQLDFLVEQQKINGETRDEQLNSLDELTRLQLQAEKNKFAERARRANEETGDAELLAAKLEKIEEEKTQALARINQKGREETERINQEFDRKALEQRQENTELAFDLIDAIIDKRAEARLSKLDDLTEANEDRQDRLQELADKGQADAVKSLEEANAEEIKLRREKEEELRRQELVQFGLAAAGVYASKVAAGDPNPLLNTIKDFTVLKAAVSALPGFFDGTDDTGNSGFMKDEHGVITGFTHKNEQVWSEADRSEVGYKSRDEIKQAVRIADSNLSTYQSGFSPAVTISTGKTREQSEIIAMHQTLKKLPENMPRHSAHLDVVKGTAVRIADSNLSTYQGCQRLE